VRISHKHNNNLELLGLLTTGICTVLNVLRIWDLSQLRIMRSGLIATMERRNPVIHPGLE
jgi:hypothetical protein